MKTAANGIGALDRAKYRLVQQPELIAPRQPWMASSKDLIQLAIARIFAAATTAQRETVTREAAHPSARLSGKAAPRARLHFPITKHAHPSLCGAAWGRNMRSPSTDDHTTKIERIPAAKLKQAAAFPPGSHRASA